MIPPRHPHRALQVIDIIDEILSKLVDDSEETGPGVELEGRRNRRREAANLLSVALCCKKFTGPGLDRLWRHMDSIVPLLKLLPGAVYSGGTIFITGPINPQAITHRVYQYAERILDLTYTIRNDFSEIHTSSWIRLSALNGGLLPSLKSFRLSYDQTTDSLIEKSLLLLPTILQSRTLISIAVDIPAATASQTHALGPVLAIISDFNLGISDLMLSGPCLNGYADRLSGIRMLKSVTLKLSFGELTTEVLTSLSNLPNLSELTLCFTDPFPISFFMGTHRFPNLIKLSLTQASIWGRRIPMISAPQLKRFVLRYMLNSTHLRAVIQAQLLLGAHPELREVDINWGADPIHRLHQTRVENFTENVRRFVHIETFILTSLDPDICITGEEITAIAAAWPHLNVLRIEHVIKPASEPTLASLHYLVKRCHHIVEISITVREEFSPTKVEEPVSFHCLRKLDLQHTVVTDHARMARWVDGLFPNLLHFSLLSESDCASVRAIIFNACQPVRRDQQRRERIRDSVMIRKIKT